MSILMRVRLVFLWCCNENSACANQAYENTPQLHADVEHGPNCHPPPPLGAAYTENVPITFVCHDTSKQGESTPQ